MDEEIKSIIMLHINMLKTQMEKDGVMFGIIVDRNDANNSKLAFIDKEKYERTGLADGFSISISELNNGLV